MPATLQEASRFIRGLWRLATSTWWMGPGVKPGWPVVWPTQVRAHHARGLTPSPFRFCKAASCFLFCIRISANRVSNSRRRPVFSARVPPSGDGSARGVLGRDYRRDFAGNRTRRDVIVLRLFTAPQAAGGPIGNLHSLDCKEPSYSVPANTPAGCFIGAPNAPPGNKVSTSRQLDAR